MKLIRLTTQDENCHFSSTFDQDIIVKPDSKIALQTLSMERVLGELAIDGNNDKITYTVRGDANSKDVFLAHTGTNPYTNSNIGLFMTDVTDKMNAALTSAGKEIGHQFNVSKNTSGMFHIECSQSDITNRVTELAANAPKRTVLGTPGTPVLTNTAAGIWNKPTGVTVANDNTYMSYLNDPLTKGSAIFRAQIWKQVDVLGASGTDGAIIGVTTINIADKVNAGNDLDDIDIDYGIYFPSLYDGGNPGNPKSEYQKIEAGIFTAAPATEVEYVGDNDTDNDVMEIKIAEGKITGQIWSNTGGATPDLVFEEDYVPGTSYYPFIIIRGSGGTAGTRLNNIKITTDPYLDPPTALHGDYHTYQLGAPQPPRGTSAQTNGYIQFESTDLADALGYETRRIPEAGFQLSRHFDFAGSFTFALHNLADSFLIQMMSMELESYDDYDKDGHGGGAKNILAVVPADASDAVVYEPNNLIWIDLHPFTLRNIHARIVKSDYSTITTRGLTSMTILVKDKGE